MSKSRFSFPLHYQIVVALVIGVFFGYLLPDSTIYTSWIGDFTLPLGATVNMNGTALYECVAVIFIAQAYGVNLTFGQQLFVIFAALLAAIGSAGIPMAGLVMMTVVLKAVGCRSKELV